MRKTLVIAVAAVAAVAVVVGVVLLVRYLQQPHSAAEQLDVARSAEDRLREKAADLAPDDLAVERERVIRLYEKVYQDFDDDGTHDDAKKRIAELYEELLDDKTRAAEVYEKLLAEHPASELAEEAVHQLARLWKEIGQGEKDQAKSVEWFRKAVDLLEKFVADHADSPRVEEDLFEIARLWQDHLQDPPIKSREALTRYLDKFPKGKFAAEAHFRLGKWYESVKEIDLAIEQYNRVTKDFPDSAQVDPALERLEEIYAKKKNDTEKAGETARKLAERHRGTAKGARYATRARSHDTEQLKKKDREYEGEYYGAPHVDVTIDKPLPPYEQYAEIIAQKLDTVGYRLDVTLNPETGELKAAGEMKLTNGGDRKEELILQLNGGMTLEKVTLSGAPVEVASPSKPGREVVRLKLSKPWLAGAEGVLAFEARGKFEAPKEVPEGIDLESGRMPDAETTQKIMASLTGDVRVRVGESGYAISGAAWYPLTVYGDVFTADVTYRLRAAGYEVAGTGRMESPSGASGTVRRYVSRTPIFGLYFAYGKYAAVETSWSDGRTIVAYVPPEQRELGRKLCETARDILLFYEERFGRLKQPRLSITISRLPVILGGIGPAGMMILAEHFVRDKEPSLSLLAHELSHQWWGNVVPISFEKGYSFWLSEGFATYCDALYNEHVHGREFLVQHLRKYGVFYFQGAVKAPALAQEVAECLPTHPLYRQTVYEKGALVLHTLRYVLGDEKFFRALREYATDFEGKHSTVEDFRRIVDRVSGADMRWFFDEWLRRKGFPHYVITGLEKGSDPDGPYTVLIQQDVPGTGAPWRTPLDVALRGADGQEHVVRKAAVDEEKNRLAVRLPWEPVGVELDPEHWVFRHPGPDNEWPRPEPQPQPGATEGEAGATGADPPGSEDPNAQAAPAGAGGPKAGGAAD